MHNAAIRAPESGGSGGRPDGQDAGALGLADRRSLAEAWSRDGLLEHASVASFARFALALMAHGAPAALVADVHRAALDEVRHAELCFALARRYADDALEPGCFPVAAEDQRVSLPATLAELAEATVREGCIGETVSAMVAAEQLAQATDPEVRAALLRIAEDEARHAELAFRAVAWALREGGADVRAAVARAFSQAPPVADEAPVGARRAELEAHGRLSSRATRAVAALAHREVIGPCARALLQATPAA